MEIQFHSPFYWVALSAKTFPLSKTQDKARRREKQGKRSVNPPVELIGAFGVLDKASIPRGKGAILCMRPELSAVDRENFIVPVWTV